MAQRFIILFILCCVTATATEVDPHVGQGIEHGEIPDVNRMIEHTLNEAPEATSATVLAPVIEAPQRSGFHFSIEPADSAAPTSATRFVARLDNAGDQKLKIGDASLWWTTPLGERTNLPLRLVDDEHWASLIDLGGAQGHHRLVLLVTIESPSSDIDRIIEEIFEFELPTAILTPRGRRELGDAPPAFEDLATASIELSAMAPAPKHATGAHPITLSSVALPFLYLNILIVTLLIVAVITLRRTPDSVRHVFARQVARLPGMNDGGARMRDVLTEAGLIDPLPVAAARPPRVKKPKKSKGKVLQAATIDESQIEREVIEEEAAPERVAPPAAIDAGKKTKLLIERLKEQGPAVDNEPTRVEEPPAESEEIEPRGRKGKVEEELPVDLNDLAF